MFLTLFPVLIISYRVVSPSPLIKKHHMPEKRRQPRLDNLTWRGTGTLATKNRQGLEEGNIHNYNIVSQ